MRRHGQRQGLGQGTYSKFGEALHWTMYDTATLAAAPVDYSMFQTPLGGAIGAAIKTLDLTNMTLGGQIPSGQKMIVKAIKVFFCSQAVKNTANITTFYTWLSQATIRVFISGKDAIYSKPLVEVLGIPIVWATTPTAAGDNLFTMSYGKYVGIDVLSKKITLASNTNFEVRLSYPVALGGGNILIGDLVKVGLAGVLLRRS